MADQVTIKNGTVTADTVNVDVQLNANTVSVNGDVTVTGNVSLNGKDITETIQEQKAELQEHATNIGLVTSPHLSSAEHEKLAQVISLFENYSTDTSIPVINAPTAAGAIDLKYFPGYFSLNAMENWDLTVAPGHVFVSRVPYANYDAETNTYSFQFSSIDAAGDAYANYNTFGDTIKAKLLDNESRQHECSTDTVEGVDDYIGKEWAFFWEYGNYIKDSSGNKHLTSIRGTTIDTDGNITGTNIKASPFDIKKNTAAFGPVFWFFCKPEKWQDPNSGEWFTSDKTENGEPIAQLWGISDSPWSDIGANHPMYNGKVYPGLSAAKKEALEALGITEEDFHIWPECKVWDSDTSSWRIRPYWIHSAFCGGYNAEIMNEDPTTAVVSICNAPLRNNLSYDSLNSPSSYNAANAPGGACVNGFGMLFDIVKNSTKVSQNIHTGISAGTSSSVTATRSITVAQQELLKTIYGGYIFPTDNITTFKVGNTARLESDITTGTNAVPTYTTNYGRQIGRIKEIRSDLAFTDTSGNELTGIKGLVIDPAENTINPVQPFEVCGSDLYTDAEGAAAAAQALNAGNDSVEGTYAVCFACVSGSMGGETFNGGTAGMGVIGKHDGSIVSNSDRRHVYRVQGTEYASGYMICAADTVALKGTDVEISDEETTITPSSADFVILSCPAGTKRYNGTNNITDWITKGYKIVGLSPATSGIILNEQLSPQGVAHPVLIGSSGGHQNSLTVAENVNKAAFIYDSYFNSPVNAGSATLDLRRALNQVLWLIAARD